MTDILLIYPSVSYTAKFEDIRDDLILDHPPLGYLYLASALEKEGLKVRVVDTSEVITLRETIKLIKKESPKIIGISALTSNIRGAVQLAEKVKEIFGKEITIGLGGHHISSDPEVIKRFSCFDFGVTGEGEITFTRLIREVVQKKKGKVEGLYRGEPPRDLDKLPFPARHLIDFKRYKDLWANNIISSRGCPYRCIFCSRPAVSKLCRFRSPELVVEEMLEAYQITGKKEYVFLDDTINLNRNHLLALCDAIIQSGLKPKWSVQARLNLVDEKLIRKMAKAGCTRLMFGVESGNERVRNEIVGKGVTEVQIKRGLSLAWKYGIEPDVFLMLGFPTETKEELWETVNFPKKYRPNMIGVHITIPLPGSRLWEDLVRRDPEWKKIIDKYIRGELGEGFRKSWPKYVPEGLTIDDLIEARDKAHRNFYLRPQYVWYRLRKDLTSRAALKKDMIEAYSLIRFGRSHWGD